MLMSTSDSGEPCESHDFDGNPIAGTLFDRIANLLELHSGARQDSIRLRSKVASRILSLQTVLEDALEGLPTHYLSSLGWDGCQLRWRGVYVSEKSPIPTTEGRLFVIESIRLLQWACEERSRDATLHENHLLAFESTDIPF